MKDASVVYPFSDEVEIYFIVFFSACQAILYSSNLLSSEVFIISCQRSVTHPAQPGNASCCVPPPGPALLLPCSLSSISHSTHVPFVVCHWTTLDLTQTTLDLFSLCVTHCVSLDYPGAIWLGPFPYQMQMCLLPLL